MTIRRNSVLRVCLICLLIACLSPAIAAAEPDCLNKQYDITIVNAQGKSSSLSDGGTKSTVRLRENSEIRAVAQNGAGASALYLYLVKVPTSFHLIFSDAAGRVILDRPFGTADDPVYGNCLFIKEYGVDIPEGTTEIRFISGSDGYLAEFRLYGSPDELPQTAGNWEPAPETADILFVVAHPDDEHVLMGGIVPYYAAEQGKNVQMVYLTADLSFRKEEALNGLWSNGMKNVPVFLDLIDKKTNSLEKAIDIWEQAGADPVGLLVEQIRRFRPAVLVTHDLEGEYGHGAHRATAYYCTQAVVLAADPAYYPESAEKYGVWDVPKLYIHLYGEDPTVLPFDEPLTAFEGKTAFEMAQVGYDAHKGSQGDGWMKLLRSREYDCAKYGLYRSLVGPDEEKNDFFEHLDSRG